MKTYRNSKRVKDSLIAISVASLLGLTLASCTSADPTPTSEPTTTAAADSTVDNLIKLGISKASENNFAEARTTFNDVIALDPGNPFAFYNLGVIAQNENDLVGALEFYGKALEANPQYTPAMFNKAIILEASDLGQAVTLYEQIITINPQAATAYYRLSLAYTTQGENDKAAETMKQALALDPTLGTQGVVPAPAPSE